MRTLTKKASFIAVLAALFAVLIPAPAQAADDLYWRKGWCYEDEGMAVVISFYNVPKSDWPAGNHLGYDVTCLFGPGLNRMTWGLAQDVPAAYLGKDLTINGSGLRFYWGIGPTLAFDNGSIRGWKTGAPKTNVNRFVEIYVATSAGTMVVPQYRKRGSGGTGPDLNPTPGTPSDSGKPKPDRVTTPGGTTTNKTGVQGTPGAGKPATDATPNDKKTNKADDDEDESDNDGSALGADENNEDRVFAAETAGDVIVPAQPLVGGPSWVWIGAIAPMLLIWSAAGWYWFRIRKAGPGPLTG